MLHNVQEPHAMCRDSLDDIPFYCLSVSFVGDQKINQQSTTVTEQTRGGGNNIPNEPALVLRGTPIPY